MTSESGGDGRAKRRELPRVRNLFAEIPARLPDEWTDEILRAGAVRIERIVSRGHSSPAGFWYDPTENEWVVVLSGSAELSFASGERVRLVPGDSLEIPAGVKHRVERTDPDRETVWLAVFFP